MIFNEGSDMVLYRGEHFHPTFARNFDVKDPLEYAFEEVRSSCSCRRRQLWADIKSSF